MFDPYGEKKGPEPQWKKSIELQRDDAALRKISDKNIKKDFQIQKKPRPDLIDNFHWVITRFRRMKKITQEQFAREISEPLVAIQMAEQGVLPERDYTLVKKIESYLGIRLIKEEKTLERERIEQLENNAPVKALTFEPNNSKSLTIADIRRIKEEKENKKSFSEFEVDFEEGSEDAEENDR